MYITSYWTRLLDTDRMCWWDGFTLCLSSALGSGLLQRRLPSRRVELGRAQLFHVEITARCACSVCLVIRSILFAIRTPDVGGLSVVCVWHSDWQCSDRCLLCVCVCWQSHNCVQQLRSLVQQQQSKIASLEAESSELKLLHSELKREVVLLKVIWEADCSDTYWCIARRPMPTDSTWSVGCYYTWWHMMDTYVYTAKVVGNWDIWPPPLTFGTIFHVFFSKKIACNCWSDFDTVVDCNMFLTVCVL